VTDYNTGRVKKGIRGCGSHTAPIRFSFNTQPGVPRIDIDDAVALEFWISASLTVAFSEQRRL
jgi:hypothetical protein